MGLTICVGRHCHGPKHNKKKTDQGADFQFVGHCPTYISWAIALLPSRGPLPYYHSVRGPLPYLHFVGHCPTSISWAIALLPFISWAIALLLCYRGPLPYYYVH